jgi:hypothetical protein
MKKPKGKKAVKVEIAKRMEKGGKGKDDEKGLGILKKAMKGG